MHAKYYGIYEANYSDNFETKNSAGLSFHRANATDWNTPFNEANYSENSEAEQSAGRDLELADAISFNEANHSENSEAQRQNAADFSRIRTYVRLSRRRFGPL